MKDKSISDQTRSYKAYKIVSVILFMLFLFLCLIGVLAQIFTPQSESSVLYPLATISLLFIIFLLIAIKKRKQIKGIEQHFTET